MQHHNFFPFSQALWLSDGAYTHTHTMNTWIWFWCWVHWITRLLFLLVTSCKVWYPDRCHPDKNVFHCLELQFWERGSLVHPLLMDRGCPRTRWITRKLFFKLFINNLSKVHVMAITDVTKNDHWHAAWWRTASLLLFVNSTQASRRPHSLSTVLWLISTTTGK